MLSSSHKKEGGDKMIKQFNGMLDFFNYLMHAYVYELKNVETKNGIQKRLADDELEKELKQKTKELIKAKGLNVDLKLGPRYNSLLNPWVQIYTPENKSGNKGRYAGISFNGEANEIELWLGFGKASRKKREIEELAKEYIIKYSLIEPKLKHGFEYKDEAIFIKKTIKTNAFSEEEFNRDLKYITDLYKAYEIRFESAIIPLQESINLEPIAKEQITYEEINSRMLALIEEVGNLAKAIRELDKKKKG